MKKIIFTAFAALALLLGVSILTAPAQALGTITAKIPFEFSIGDKRFAAGEYTIKMPTSSGISAVTIRNISGTSAYIALSDPIKPTRDAENTGLVFITNGERNFLYQILVPGLEVGQELLVSKKLAGRRIARSVVLLRRKTI